MCPFCLPNLAFIAASAASTSGLSALAANHFLKAMETGKQRNYFAPSIRRGQTYTRFLC